MALNVTIAPSMPTCEEEENAEWLSHYHQIVPSYDFRLPKDLQGPYFCHRGPRLCKFSPLSCPFGELQPNLLGTSRICKNTWLISALRPFSPSISLNTPMTPMSSPNLGATPMRSWCLDSVGVADEFDRILIELHPRRTTRPLNSSRQ